jgi:hypothetical protein
MKARLIINEIVRGGDGFGSLGVGHVAMMKAYNYTKSKWPKYMEKNAKPMEEYFSNNKFKFLSRMESKFNISMNDYLWLEWRVNINQVFEDWVRSIKYDKTLAINPSTWDNNDVRIAKYNYDWNMGYLSMSNGMFDDNKVQGYFFKYK